MVAACKWWLLVTAALWWQVMPMSAQCLNDFTDCTCNTVGGRVIIDCNAAVSGASIQEIMVSMREIGLTESVTQLTFVGAPDTSLETDVFLGLTELRVFYIQHCMNLTKIRPGAFHSLSRLESLNIENCPQLSELNRGVFDSLSNLDTLRLRSNALEWLSRESFEGIGSLLLLDLSSNMLKNLQSDLQELFELVNETITLSNNQELVCDCHLKWLVEFISRNPTPPPRIVLDNTFCSSPPNTLINDPSVDFNTLACLDLCALGYHNCHQHAACTQDSGRTLCSCNNGYTGDGIVCVQVQVGCDSLLCDDNAMCDSNSPIARCTCNPGYTGNGRDCILIVLCEDVCSSSDDPEIRCILSHSSERVHCGSDLIQQLQEMLLLYDSVPSLDPGLVMFSSQLEMATRNVSLPGDIPSIVDLLVQSVNVFREENNFENETFQNFVRVGSELLHIKNQPLWSQINRTSVSDHVTDLFIAMERLGEALFLINGLTVMDQVITSDNIALVIAVPNCTSSNNGSITISTGLLDGPSTGGDSSIQLPSSVFGTEFNCSEVGIIAIIYDGVGPLLNIDGELIPDCTPTPAPLVYGQCKWSDAVSVCPELEVNSVVISATAVSSDRNNTINQLNTTRLSDPIIITLHHENTTSFGPVCGFLNDEQTLADDGSWQTDGCQVVREASSSNTTVCECYHLTSFALLTSPTGPTTQEPVLQIVSTIGLCISIICLMITIGLLFGLKMETKKLHHIHRQLALALCLAQLLFLVGVDRTLVPSPDVLCTIIAFLLHYLFLCTFAWQLVEGVHLYLFIVKVFFNQNIIWAYYPLAWGVPLIIVAITFGIRFCDYGSEKYCWITNENGANWAFHGPVIAIIIVNVVIMIIVIGTIIRLRRKRKQDTFLICTLIHASVVLVPILGITWILGFLVIGDNTFATIVEWLFCIFTTLQGVMIFVMHCILNRDVRKAFLTKFGCHEAAKKQERFTFRRSSTVQSFSQISVALKRTLSLSKTRRSSVGDSTSFQLDNSLSPTLKFNNARPSSACGYPSIRVTNPLLDITEEGDSLQSSLACTPRQARCNQNSNNNRTEPASRSQQNSPDITPTLFRTSSDSQTGDSTGLQ